MQGIEQRLRLLLPDGLALIGRKLLDLTLDFVDPRKLLQRELGDLPVICRSKQRPYALDDWDSLDTCHRCWRAAG